MDVISGDTINERYKVEFALHQLHHAEKEKYFKNYWLSPDRKTEVGFILDLGCKDSFNTVELVNTHNSNSKDRSTKQFHAFLR